MIEGVDQTITKTATITQDSGCEDVSNIKIIFFSSSLFYCNIPILAIHTCKYRRSGFDCEIRISSFSGACNQKNHKVQLEHILIHGTGSTVAIIRFAV